MKTWTHKDLLGLEELSAAEITTLLDATADAKREFLDGRASQD